jgi:uncharacterized membrane protein YqjE
MLDTEVSRVKSLLRTLALYVEARGRLLQIEAQEAGTKLSEIAILVAVICGCLLFGWMLALPALVWMLADSQGWPWWQVALGAAGIHMLLAIFFFLSLRARLKRLHVFEETFRQFQRDREVIGNPPTGE